MVVFMLFSGARNAAAPKALNPSLHPLFERPFPSPLVFEPTGVSTSPCLTLLIYAVTWTC
jgi:hypothetical protein